MKGGNTRIKAEEKELVGAAGFEPATPCPPGKCATKLRYAPTMLFDFVKVFIKAEIFIIVIA